MPLSTGRIVVVSSEFEFLDGFLSDVNLQSKDVLDAGSGARSALFLALRNPGKLICIVGPGDVRKEEEAGDSLQSMGYKDYQVVQEDLACENPSRSDSLDFILAHYLIQSVDGFAPLGVYKVLCSLHSYLRRGGELVIIEPEPLVPFRPEYEILSTYEIRGDAELEKRNSKDLIDVLYFLVTTATRLTLLNTATEGHYPSEWVYNWLANLGFTELRESHFDIKVHVSKEFTQRAAFARDILSKMGSSKLRDGLLEKLEEVISAFNRRSVTKDDFFLHRHYAIRAGKN